MSFNPEITLGEIIIIVIMLLLVWQVYRIYKGFLWKSAEGSEDTKFELKLKEDDKGGTLYITFGIKVDIIKKAIGLFVSRKQLPYPKRKKLKK